jgi:hypothetical protein
MSSVGLLEQGNNREDSPNLVAKDSVNPPNSMSYAIRKENAKGSFNTPWRHALRKARCCVLEHSHQHLDRPGGELEEGLGIDAHHQDAHRSQGQAKR